MYTRLDYINEYFRKKFEISEGFLSRYCKLDKRLSELKIDILNSLATAFGVTIDDLVNEWCWEQLNINNDSNIHVEYMD